MKRHKLLFRPEKKRRNRFDINKRCNKLPILTSRETVWSKTEPSKNGYIILSWPIYDDDVDEWIHMFYKLDLLDMNYLEHNKKLKNKAIHDMKRDELLTMLTFYIRGEHFCTGLLAGRLKDGTLEQLTTRLKEVTKPRLRPVLFLSCTIICLLIVWWLHAWFGILEPFKTHEEIRNRLYDIYGKDFILLSSEDVSEGFEQRCIRYTACPQDNPDFHFTIREEIGGSPGPIPGYHHTLRDNYALLIYNERLAAFFKQENIVCTGFVIYVSGKTLEETVSAIADFINSLNSQYPFDRAISLQELPFYRFVYELDGITVTYEKTIYRNSDMPYYSMDAKQVIDDLEERMQAEQQNVLSTVSKEQEER